MNPNSGIETEQSNRTYLVTNDRRPSDELILQHLGASVMLCWADLPRPAQRLILDQAQDVIGFAPITAARGEIVQLLQRRGIDADQLK
jgi:hypothetical protein